MKKRNLTKEKKEKNNLFFKLVMLILFISGLITFLYPFLSDAMNNFHDQSIIERYQKEYSSLNKQQQKARQKELQLKNEQLLKNNKLTNIPGMGLVKDPFEEATKDARDPGQEYFKNHMLGAIFIPKIKVSLPIFDETNDLLLDKGATVLQGTSFPIGGKGTHSVITGHSGLPEKKLFTDLEKLKKGDVFYITVAGSKLAYRISNFKKVLPTDLDSLKITENMDQVTLVTCTPYMVNTHRLLVTGLRIPYNEEDLEKQINSTKKYNILKLVIILILILIFLLIVIYKIWKMVKSYLNNKD
ncbi:MULTISPECIES: class C sortase [Lactococcus]|uniref:class C sortase n=1 Tax=Lactococcus TaxID=1357 RepID=UPI001F06CF56|nr:MULTISPECIES: class C sortase [Lactococcus]MCH1713830.1 class C sortase [Lactococcus petauri]